MMKKRNTRTGASAVEFALVAPVFVLLVFGIVEFGRVMLVQQVLVSATREGSRRAVLEGATSNSVRATVSDFLTSSSVDIPSDSISISPDPAVISNNEEITVSVSVPFRDVSWSPPFIYDGDLQARTTMRSEKID